MRLLFAGDAHGNSAYMRAVIDQAKKLEIRQVVQLGDYGFWPNGHSYLGAIRRRAAEAGVGLWIIDGNHDYPGLGERTDAGHVAWQTADPQIGGYCTIERGAVVTIDGTRVGFMGGAVSVDRDRRTLGRSYWIDETVNDDDVARAIDAGPVDVWLTHDAVGVPPVLEKTSWPDPYLQHDVMIAESRMRSMFEALQPRLHVHGHFHVGYAATTKYGVVVGLGCEDVATSCIVVDTDDLAAWSWLQPGGR